MIELGAGLVLAVQPLMARDLTPAMVDRDLARADPRADLQSGQRDRHRVAVLTDRDQRLAVHPGRGGLARVIRLARQREQQRALCRPRLTDRHRPSIDPASKIGLAALQQQRVQLGEVCDMRDRNEMIAPASANFALDASLFVCPLKPRGRELRLKQIVRAHRHEPVRLDPPAALEHLLHRRLKVVKPDAREHAAKPFKRLHVQLQKRLLGLDQRRLTERRARERRAHHEQMHHRRDPREHHQRLAPIDLALHPGRVNLRDEHLGDRPPQLALARPHILTHRNLGNISTMLIDQPPPDPPRGMPLLTRRVPISQQPPVDHRPIRAELRRWTAHRRALDRRHRRHQRITHRPAMHAMPHR